MVTYSLNKWTKFMSLVAFIFVPVTFFMLTSERDLVGASYSSVSRLGSSFSTNLLGQQAASSIPPGKGKVVMLTASSGTQGFLSIPHIKDMVYENRMSYAERHGFEFMWSNITSYAVTPEEACWSKTPAIQEAFLRFPDAEWVWWLDLDVILMNQSYSLWDNLLTEEGMKNNAVFDEKLMRPGGAEMGLNTPASYNYSDINFIFASDNWGMNAGSYLLRRSVATDWLLDYWVEPLYLNQHWTFSDNDAWIHMYAAHPIVRKHTLHVNQRSFNAYPEYNQLGNHWQDGDLLVHFAGCGNRPECPSHWNDYWDKREVSDVPEEVKQRILNGTAEIESYQMGVGLVKQNGPYGQT